MEKVFFVKNGNLKEVNEALVHGGKVKMIQAVAESVPAESCTGDVYAYVVISYS